MLRRQILHLNLFSAIWSENRVMLLLKWQSKLMLFRKWRVKLIRTRVSLWLKYLMQRKGCTGKTTRKTSSPSPCLPHTFTPQSALSASRILMNRPGGMELLGHFIKTERRQTSLVPVLLHVGSRHRDLQSDSPVPGLTDLCQLDNRMMISTPVVATSTTSSTQYSISVMGWRNKNVSTSNQNGCLV